jgi:anti-anti-sigma regulatory factor
MGLLEASSGVVAYEGELVGQACEDFTVALDLLRISETKAPVVDLTGVTRISRYGVDLLVSLRSDMSFQGRRFKLLASDPVWDVLGQAGVADVFVEDSAGSSHERGNK